MQNPRLATRYAKSLLDLAIEQNQLDATLQDVEILNSTCKASSEFCGILRSPVIKADKKNAIIDAVVGAKMHPLAKGFLHLLVNKGREGVLPEIAAAFMEQYKAMKNIHTVKITTATPVDERVAQALKAKAATAMPTGTVEIETAVNPDLIGGFVMEIGNSIVDASIRRDLNDIRKQFMENIYISKIGG